MKYTFQHYIDIQTSASSLTMVQIQAGGRYAMERIKHLLGAYKYIKLGRVSVKLLPASTLPVDPLGLSYDSSDPLTIDPRDQMNPGLVRITNGEDIMTDFTGLSDTAQEQMYINTMLDPRWSKFMLQSGFKRSAVPLYWNVGQLAQDPYPGTVVNMPHKNTATSDILGATDTFQFNSYSYNDGYSSNFKLSGYYESFNSDPRGIFQVGHRGRMGWMPVDAFYNRRTINADTSLLEDDYQPMFQALPEVNVITCLFPKAYKTIYYYRMFITETVYLSGLKNTGINEVDTGEYRAIDNFVVAPYPLPRDPSSPLTTDWEVPSANDGGGDQS